MKILKLTAENFKKLSVVEITPDGNMVLITGKNAAGKSSVLDSIEATLRGGRCLPKQPIRTGEIRGKTETLLGDTVPEYKVTRKFFGTTSSLVVETVGETKSKISSPQAFLDSVVGSISFDPLVFLNKQPAEQRNTLMEFLGLNLDEFDNKIVSLKSQRSETRKEKEKKLHEAESIVPTPNLPPQEVSSDSLLVELQTIRHHNDDRQQMASKNAVTVSRLETTKRDIKAAQKAIKDWEKREDALRGMETELEKQLKTVSPFIASAGVERKLQNLSDANEAIRRNNQRKRAIADYDIYTAAYKDLGEQIKNTEHQKAKKMAEAVMPVEGLTILPDGLGYNGLPLEQECDSKKLKICVAISMALNPKLKVLRISGNDLDKNSRAIIGQLVADKDYQAWMEVVSDDDTIGFYIEDGTLVETRKNAIAQLEEKDAG